MHLIDPTFFRSTTRHQTYPCACEREPVRCRATCSPRRSTTLCKARAASGSTMDPVRGSSRTACPRGRLWLGACRRRSGLWLRSYGPSREHRREDEMMPERASSSSYCIAQACVSVVSTSVWMCAPRHVALLGLSLSLSVSPSLSLSLSLALALSRIVRNLC